MRTRTDDFVRLGEKHYVHFEDIERLVASDDGTKTRVYMTQSDYIAVPEPMSDVLASIREQLEEMEKAKREKYLEGRSHTYQSASEGTEWSNTF